MATSVGVVKCRCYPWTIRGRISWWNWNFFIVTHISYLSYLFYLSNTPVTGLAMHHLLPTISISCQTYTYCGATRTPVFRCQATPSIGCLPAGSYNIPPVRHMASSWYYSSNWWAICWCIDSGPNCSSNSIWRCGNIHSTWSGPPTGLAITSKPSCSCKPLYFFAILYPYTRKLQLYCYLRMNKTHQRSLDFLGLDDD